MVPILRNKKSFLLLWVMCLMALFPVAGWGAVGDKFTFEGLNYEVIDEDLNTVKVGDNKNYASNADVTIPTEVRNPSNDPYTVVEIDGTAFEDNTILATITISGSVKTIGQSAFNACTSLTKVNMSDGTKKIGDYAFKSCNLLATVTLGNETESIGRGAFMGTALTTITIPETVTTIGKWAFKEAVNLTTMTCLGTTPATVEVEMFTGCTNLNSIYVPKAALDDYKTKWGAEYASDIKVKPDYEYTLNADDTAVITKYLGTDAVVTIPATVEGYTVVAIGDNAFQSNTTLTAITIPGSVNTIGENAFASCTGLATVTLNEGTKTIGNGAFAGAANLTTVICLGITPAKVGTNLFKDCTKFNIIYVFEAAVDKYREEWTEYKGYIKVKPNPNYTYTLNNNNRTAVITKYLGTDAVVIIPKTVEEYTVVEIGERAFESNANLTEITIPGSVITISNFAFSSCKKLITATLVNGTEKIGEAAFMETALTTISIPGSVKTIGDGAFFSCKNLTTVTLNDGTETIEMAAFGQTALTTIIIPGTVKAIEKEAFLDAANLTTMTCLGTTPPVVGADLFKGCTKFSHINVPKEVLNNYRSVWAEYVNYLDNPTPPVPPTVWYNVRVPATEGVLFSCQNQETDSINQDVLDKGSLTFYIKLKPDYIVSGLKVTTNRGEVLLPRDSDNKYIVNNISENVEVKVEGVHPTGNEAINADQVKVWTSNGELHIEAPAQEKVHIVTFAGALLKQLTTSGGHTSIALTPGAYIVRVGQQSFKVNL